MSAELLREAAAEMRFDAPTLGSDAFLLAVADWLDETARLRDSLGPNAADWPAALAVARAYLDEPDTT